MLKLRAMDPSKAAAFLAEQGAENARTLSDTVGMPLPEAETLIAAQRKNISSADPNQYFFELVDDETRVGRVWLAVYDANALFVGQVDIDPAQRRKGYGTRAMQLIEKKAAELNCSQVWLHVFASNAAARALYRKTGYKESGIQMFKVL